MRAHKLSHGAPWILVASRWLGVLVCLVQLVVCAPVQAACPGCCSSHGGIVSACAPDGRVYCADGSVSPSCLCSTCGVSNPTPSCTGGRVLVGNVCACPGGSQWASLDGVCHTPRNPSGCGTERWLVKTGADTTVSEIDATVTPATVENLAAFEAPTALSEATRSGTLERTTLILDGILTSYVMTADADYQLTIRGDSGLSMSVAVPHPNCVAAQSPYLPAIRAARSAVDNAIATTQSIKTTTLPIRLTGVGFFATPRVGAAANGVELHPVTQATFIPVGALPTTPEITVVEYYSIGTDSYFLTGRKLEKTLLDGLPTSFRRTGMTLTTLSAAGTPGTANAICRYYFNDHGINSTHFYGAANDCPVLKSTSRTNTQFNDEGFDFSVGAITSPSGPVCGSIAPFAVSRSFRNGASGKTVNHRYTVSAATYAATTAAGYVGEGPVYCVVSATDAR